MKIAVIYNRESKNVINLFGIPNREKYGKKAITRIVDSLKKYGHQVRSVEGDKDLILKLEEFMPRVLKGEIPGFAFNLSYGIQGQARYTHVPGILEMVGIPYVGSGPLAHSLALDKVVAKMIFVQNGLPTPPFAVFNPPDVTDPGLSYPLIVKPKNEAVSMGIKVVNSKDELFEAVQEVFSQFNQAALVEQFIEGREINVGLLGNNPPEVLPPCEIVISGEGPNIYTIEDKRGKSGRTVDWLCPAPIGKKLMEEAQQIARDAFTALGCYDCARVDMRLDNKGNLYILEINSLPSLGEHGSYVIAAEHVGLDFPALINRLVEVASARYFGTPTPPQIKGGEKDPETMLFSYITSHRDLIERELEEWTLIGSRSTDPVGNTMAINRLDSRMKSIKMQPAEDFTDRRSVWTWETKKGLEGGTLFIGHIDVPLGADVPIQPFRRDPEWLYGEGIGISRAPLVMLEFILRALRHNRMLHQLPLGVLYYLDEGRDCRYSAEIIRGAVSKAKRVLVLRPGGTGDTIRTQRRGQRKYRLVAEGKSHRIGYHKKMLSVLSWCHERLLKLDRLSSRKDRLAVSVVDIKVDTYRMSVPHRVTATIIVSYLDPKVADGREAEMREIFGKDQVRWRLALISDRPPMRERRINQQLAKSLAQVAEKWDIPLGQESSLIPSVGGLVPARVPVVCGIGPVTTGHYSPQEAVQRVSLIQRTLLITEFLAKEVKREKR